MYEKKCVCFKQCDVIDHVLACVLYIGMVVEHYID